MRTLILCVAVLSLGACKKAPEAAAEPALTAAAAVTSESEQAADVAAEPCEDAADEVMEQRPDVARKELREEPGAPGCPKTPPLVDETPQPEVPVQPDLPQ